MGIDRLIREFVDIDWFIKGNDRLIQSLVGIDWFIIVVDRLLTPFYVRFHGLP